MNLVKINSAKSIRQRHLWKLGRLAVALIMMCSHQAMATVSFSNPEDDCKQCHPRQYQEWVGSSHAYASVSPTFNALELIGNDTMNGQFSAGSNHTTELFCQACHTPAAVEMDKTSSDKLLIPFNPTTGTTGNKPTVEILQGITSPAAKVANAKTALRGNSCDVCHQAIGPQHFQQASPAPFFYNPFEDGFGGIANASFNFLSSSGEKYGPFANLTADGHDVCQASDYGAMNPTCVTTGNQIQKGGYLSDSQFCGSCHDVRPPVNSPLSSPQDVANGYLPLEALYTEWKESAWAQGTLPLYNNETSVPATCQDCHMSTYPYGDTIGEPPRPRLYPIDGLAINKPDHVVSSHYFTGVDVSLLDPADFAEVPTGDGSKTYNSQETLARRKYEAPTTKYIPHTAPNDDYSFYEDSIKEISMPIGQHQRRVDLLKSAVRLDVDYNARSIVQGKLDLNVTLENVGAGHSVPSGFSQERQFWVAIEVRDANENLLYETGHLTNDSLKELQKLVKIELDPYDLEIKGSSLQAAATAAGVQLSSDPESLTHHQFEDYLIATHENNVAGDKDLVFFGNEFKRKNASAGQSSEGIEVFSPFLADEMDNLHSLPPFQTGISNAKTFAYNITGMSYSAMTFPLTVKTTLNYRAFPPRFLKGLQDAMEARGHTALLPQQLIERNKVIEMAKAEFSISGLSSSTPKDQAMISANGRCFDLPWDVYNNPNDPGKVQLWDCNNQDNQRLVVRANGHVKFKNDACLTIPSVDWNTLTNPDNIPSGIKVGVDNCIQYPSSLARQRWISNSNGLLYVEKGGDKYCLQRTSFTIGGAGELTLAKCWDPVRQAGSSSVYTQQWFYQPSFRPIINGSSAPSAKKCLNVNLNGGLTGTATLANCNNSLEQQWRLSEKGLLINAAGTCLDVNNGDLSAGVSVGAWHCSEQHNPSSLAAHQKWRFEAGSLRTAFNSDNKYFCLGTQNGQSSNGTALKLVECNAYQTDSDPIFPDLKYNTTTAFKTLLWEQ